MVKHWSIATFLLLLLATLYSCRALREDERLEEYRKRGYTWPPKEEEYVPNTKEWKERSKHRLHQIELIDQGGGERYQGFMFGVSFPFGSGDDKKTLEFIHCGASVKKGKIDEITEIILLLRLMCLSLVPKKARLAHF